MNNINNVASSNAALLPQPLGTPLETGQFDFMNFFLGLQANPTQEWWQGGLDDKAKQALSDKTDPFLMPSVSAGPVTSIDTFQALQSMIGGAESSTSQNGFIPTQSLVSATEVSPKVAAADLSMLELLSKPIEDLHPDEIKKLVDSVWGDVQSISVENHDRQSEVDSANHALMRKMAAETNKIQPPSSNQNADTVGELSSSQVIVPKDMPSEVATSRSDKKELKSESGSPFSLDSTAPRESIEVVEKAEAPTPVRHSQLMPQVMPKVDSLISQGGGKVTMEIDPPEMGRVTIEVTTRGKHVELSIRSDNHATRVALEDGMADLKTALQSQDLQLTRAEVQTTTPSSYSSLSFGQSNSGGSDQPSGGERQYSAYQQEEKSYPQHYEARGPVRTTWADGRLDVRV